MIKAFCLAVMCLLYMAVVLALKPTMSSRAVQDAAALHTITSVASTSGSSGAFPVADTLSNADRSPTASSFDAVQEVAAEESKIAPVAADPRTPPTFAATKPEVVSWHWRVGSKITKRTAVRDRGVDVSRAVRLHRAACVSGSGASASCSRIEASATQPR
jgi:hypothetical protein